MRFLFTAAIGAPVERVFDYLRDIDQVAGKPGTVVPVYEKETPGPVAVGTRYREVVRLLPGLNREMMGEIVLFEPPWRLGYRFRGLGMSGALLYSLRPIADGTHLIQVQTLTPCWPWKLIAPLIGLAFCFMARRRLPAIKRALESPREDAGCERTNPLCGSGGSADRGTRCGR